MNDTLQELYNRKSVRVYTADPITPEEQRTILEAALQAPSAGNMCLYSILNITDPALKERLADTCDHQPFIATAPLVLVFCADYQRWYDAFCRHTSPVRQPAEGDLFLAMSDTLIAAQNAVVAAESMGIGSCYIGDIMEHYDIHRELLGLPRYVLPVCMVCFGRPTPQQQRRPKPARFAVEDVVYENRYTSTDMTAMLSRRQGFADEQEAADWIRRFCKRKWNCAFSEEMSRSVRAMIDSWTQGAAQP